MGAARRATSLQDIAQGILRAVAYADLFDYPLTTHEIHRYLPGQPTSLGTVHQALAKGAWLRQHLAFDPPYWYLRGRDELVRLRRRRAAYAEALWPWARLCGQMAAGLPFMRLVAISGSLTMDNVTGPRDDIDFLIVARTGRVWSARGAMLLLRRLMRPLGITVCPNFVLSEGALELEDRSLFTARELAQLVPLYGQAMYRSLMASNPWVREFLPNASPQHAVDESQRWMLRGTRGLGEAVLGGRLGDMVERWERERKIPKLLEEVQHSGSDEARFAPHVCKGHRHSHRTRVSTEYAERLRALGISG